MIHHESLEQQALFQWAMLSISSIPELELLHHIPNGGKRNAREAARLKKEGVRAGVPDIFLPVPRKKYNGMYIELKAKVGRLSDNQKWWIERLEQQGYYCQVCYGWEAARNVILSYLI